MSSPDTPTAESNPLKIKIKEVRRRRVRRKTDHCLNCGLPLDESFDYCPRCGQENSNHQASFRKLFAEVFDDYVSLDSRFGRSIKPFLLDPGSLTKNFMMGHRVKYANPVRLYLLISILHFFVLSLTYDNGDLSQVNALQNVSSDSTSVTDFFSIDLGKGFLDIPDSALQDSLMLNEKTITLVQKMTEEERSMRDIIGAIFLRQSIKLEKSGATSLERYTLQNMPILIFILLPIYAAILKLFFPRRLYINHLIHSLHLHSFLFLILTPFWIYSIFRNPSYSLVLLVFCLATAYTVTSFIKVYHIPIKKALLETFLSGMAYLLVLSIAFLIMLIFSFFTF